MPGRKVRMPADPFARAPPRSTRGRAGSATGIRARSRQGEFSVTWWGRRWIEVLEGFGWTARLRRGRQYARAGRVLHLRVLPGRVDAEVQGSRRTPYRVRLAVARLPDRAWDRAIARVGRSAEFASALLGGRLPEMAESEFRAARAPLLPARDGEFESDCTCPDWANPCKHIAAVHYLLAESMDRDPFVLLALRGRPRAELLSELRQKMAPPRSVRRPASGRPRSERAPTDARSPATPPMTFWGDTERLLAIPAPAVRPSPVPDAVLRRLGEPAFLRGTPEIVEFLRSAYDRIGERARTVAFSEGSGTEPTAPATSPNRRRVGRSPPDRDA